MKRIIALVLAVVLLGLSGCSTATTENKKIVAVSFYPIYIFTLNLVDGIDEIEIKSIGEQNTGCLHDYTITAGDARLISDAKLLIINGAGMEGFIEDLYSSEKNLRVVDSSDGAKLICSENHHHHHHEETGVEMTQLSHVSFNSHIWLSVSNAKIQVLNIKNALVKFFPEYEKQINENYEGYIERLTSLEKDMQAAKVFLEGKNTYAFHEAYGYLSYDLGFNIVRTIESGEGGEPSARALAELSREAKADNIKAIFVEPYYNGSAAEIISRETGVEIYVLNPITSGEKTKTAYEDIMRENIKILKAVN